MRKIFPVLPPARVDLLVSGRSPAEGGGAVYRAVVPEAVVAGGVAPPQPGAALPGLRLGEVRRAGVGPLDARLARH